MATERRTASTAKPRFRIYVEDAKERLLPVHPEDMPALFEKNPEEAAKLMQSALKRARSGR